MESLQKAPTTSAPPGYDGEKRSIDAETSHEDFKAGTVEAATATTKEHSLTLVQAIRAYPRAIMWSLLLSSAVIMEGYDTLLVSNIADS